MSENRDYVLPHSPPSSYAIADLIERRPGSVGRVAQLTVTRALFAAPGLWLAGVRGRQLLVASVAASATITAWLIAYYAARRRKL